MISKTLTKIIALVLIFSFESAQVFSQDLSAFGIAGKEKGARASGSEYISGDYPGAVLMKVNLWGSVGKPGIHMIPLQTDLITLLSYAGGPLEGARLSGVYIKRWTLGKQELIEVDAEKLLKGTTSEPPLLQANDIVVIPKKEPIVSADTSTVISLIASVLSIVGIGIVLVNTNK